MPTAPQADAPLVKAGLLVVCFVVLALCGAQAASAGIALNTIDSHVTQKQRGALVRSTGPIGCTRGERITISVRVSQRETGARARQSWTARCTGEVQHWRVRARARHGSRFGKGPGMVCAVAETRSGSRVSETRKWCRPVFVSAGY